MGLFLYTNSANSTTPPPNFISSRALQEIAFGFTHDCNAIVFHCNFLGLKLGTLNLFLNRGGSICAECWSSHKYSAKSATFKICTL